jgi:hypothetical protein
MDSLTTARSSGLASRGSNDHEANSIPVFDLHQHLWPPSLLEHLSERSTAPLLRGSRLTTTEGIFEIDLAAHRLDCRLAALDASGIDVAVVSLQPTLGFEGLPDDERKSLVASYHKGILELVEDSRGRLRALAAGEFVQGFDGVCVGASRLIQPEGLAGVLDPLERSDGFLFIHPDAAPIVASTPDWWSALTGYTAGMQAAYLAWIDRGAPSWPDLKVLFAILAGGAPFQLERLRSRGVETRTLTGGLAYFDTSSYGRMSLELCLASYGVDRLVHGSDFPVIDPTSTMSAITALGKVTAHAVYRDNPQSLLP